MTGKHTGHTRVRGNGSPERQMLRAEDVTVAKLLKQAGYTTGLVGKWGLGEAGSQRLGFLVAALPAALIPSREHHALLVTWIAPVMLMGVPVGDFLFVHVRRYRNGVRHPLRLMTSTGKDHLPHRLLDTGLSTRHAALWLYGATGLMGASAVSLVLFGPVAAAIPIVVLVTTGAAGWVAGASARSA
jgi:hypothetical protein